MNDTRYKLILYVIVLVILGTIGIQVYWNYKNYNTNKQQLINDAQISLDNAVEKYYANLAEQSTIAFASEGKIEAFFDKSSRLDSILHEFNFSNKGNTDLDSLNRNGISIYRGITSDSVLEIYRHKDEATPENGSKIIRHFSTSDSDSILKDNFKMLTSKIVFSMTSDTLLLEKIDSILITELARKGLTFDYGLTFKTPFKKKHSVFKDNLGNTSLSTISKSPFLPPESTLTIHFTNETKVILKRILTGILISTLLVLTVIACLFYLLKIIKHQKQLAEVKNDLISNITHEFKTPIATISVALESIKNFNIIDDKEKTKNYLNMSSDQLLKLNVMVEKLLETATLDSENLDLNKEEINLTKLLHSIIEKHQLSLKDKTIDFNIPDREILFKVDIFHFENTISNVIDNAIKYGGKEITVNLDQKPRFTEITITDNGNILSKANINRIFEKFYRVQKGNTHDVKGFGIGLYYTKKIIEKHGGTILVLLDNNTTSFKIKLPNE